MHGADRGANRLHGRRAECSVLDGVLEAVRGGESRSLVIRGEAGVGKTALLEYAVEAASDFRVTRVVGVESEMELAFAGMHQLCGSMLESRLQLPGPQREALDVVFGLSGGGAPDRFLVGLAVLGLVSEVASERPMAIVVDDAQWLDRASVQVIAFLARRLSADSVAVVFATREPVEDLRGLPELEVQGLRNGDARALLGSVVRFPLDERVRDRIVAETRGNPLALLELPRGMTATQLAGGFGLLATESLSGRIEESFLSRLENLPSDTQRLLLVAAAETVGDPLVVWAAAEQLDIGASAAHAASDGGLLAIEQRVTFSHPLIRSAVYRSAAPDERRAAHLALAEVIDRTVDPDRRAWHLAAAATGPDEEVALELEQSAGRAQARGGLAAAAAFMQRAVALTRDADKRADRALAAAAASLQAGAFDTTLRLLAAAETGPVAELQSAQIDLLRGQVAFASGFGSEAPPKLLKAARRFEPLDLDLARETYLNAWGAAAFAGSPDDLLEICRAARALPVPAEPARAIDLLLDGLTLMITDGLAEAAPLLRQAVSVFASQDLPAEQGLRWGWMATAASNAMWDVEGTRAVCERQIQLVRNVGALESLPIYLVPLAAALVWSGDFAEASSLVSELEEVKAATGAHILPFASLHLLGLQGNEEEAVPLILTTLKQAADAGQGIAVSQAQWVASVLYNGLGRYGEALDAAEQASSDALQLFAADWALPELVEAAMRSGKPELARDALQRLAHKTEPAAAEIGLGLVARSRALLSDGEDAEKLYQEAIDRLGRTRLRPELARAHLLYGEWLRREGRRVQARDQLHTAHNMFNVIGMHAFGERARHELLATGERVRKRRDETRADLTAQEEQIARLARDGLSNSEIAARLFISARTVEWHLRKVFAKLGISSRMGLHAALPTAHAERATA